MFEKILSIYTRYFAIWVVVFGAVAYVWPAPFRLLEPGNKWFFALTMFGIGVVLQMEDFRRILRSPTIVLIGSVAQFTIMPLGAFVVSRLLRLPDELAIGLILTGAAPGAMSSNVMSYIAKADTAYSVSLTTVSTALCPVLTPTLTFLLASGTEFDVSIVSMMVDLMLMVIIPLFVGFAVRHFLGERLRKVLPIFPAISATFIVFICSLVIALNRDRLQELRGIVLIAVVVLNLRGMLSGYGVGSLFRMDVARRRTLTIEIGMQNAGLGTVLALKHFGPGATMPTAVFVFVCIITASIMASIWQRHGSSAVAEAK
ncbi:MAG TPA: bile acid:sodium symporter family protein [Sedimentisphaerales bacterium]|jgi:BASS family bile acid:Na+ symporter|nr:bile acid:sodium symporter family protein [Sedimentisphaerales bacterium]HNU27792.1 bile acid:sodium symporter family protein [Sedimentisphaerales bacterium]